MAGNRNRTALLRSATAHPGTGRFSILAADPWLTLSWTAGTGELEGPDGRGTVACRDPFELVASWARRVQACAAPPWPFPGGAIGWFSYDAGRALERLPELARDDRHFPWVDVAFYSWGINWDHHTGRWAVLATGAPGQGDPFKLCQEAASWATGSPGADPPRTDLPPAPPSRAGGNSALESSLGREEYMAGVQLIRELIREGECYQVNLTRRITSRRPVDPLRLFGELLRSNPAPFAAWIEGSRGVLVGSSPERFLRVRDGRAESRPVKGTIRRPGDPAGDRRAARALARSEKNRAENVMIVDLVRNDLGRVCLPGSIQVDDLCRVESFQGVHHLVSTVSGRVEPGAGPLDVVRALFPAGSMTGAPKIRAMEIIEGLEPVRRGPYAGAAGYLSAAGDLDLSVVIRSFLLSGDRADLQVGGAVVADSDPSEEWEESALKAERALGALEAAALPERGATGRGRSRRTAGSPDVQAGGG